MKVLLINPWAIKNDGYYASGFVSEMSVHVQLDFATNFYYAGPNPSGTKYPLFFKKSETMPSSVKRKLVRGIEYSVAWRKIIGLAKARSYDVIHIHWLLMYDIDLHYLTRLKTYAKRLVLTAHNVLPHVNGESHVDMLRKIYGVFDVILLHGESIKSEFVQYFPEYEGKLAIQYHGEYYQQDTSYSVSEMPDFVSIKEKLRAFEKAYIMFGMQFYNKGTDRLIKIWKETFADQNILLMVIGKTTHDYLELKELIPRLEGVDNLLFINHFVDDNTLNYAISRSDWIILPYRHASMSGVIYTAAVFSKPIICTRSGAIAEYLEDGIDGIICDVDDESLKNALILSNSIEQAKATQMGEQLTENITRKYSWMKITKDLFEKVYNADRYRFGDAL